MDGIPNWIIAFASVVNLIVILVLKKQIAQSHERGRREQSVDLMRFWCIHLDQRSSIARIFVEKLDHDQSQSLWNKEPFKIDKKHEELMIGCLGREIVGSSKDRTINLKAKDSTEIRWIIISFLNKLESVMTAWRHNVADRKMIMEEFKYLVSPSQDHYILETFRTVARGDSHDPYPAISEFVEAIKKENEKSPKGKGEIA